MDGNGTWNGGGSTTANAAEAAMIPVGSRTLLGPPFHHSDTITCALPVLRS